MIIVEQYNCEWKDDFKSIENYLRSVIPTQYKIEHVGSTSVEGLAAKPIIDIVILAEENKQEELIQKLESIGYTHRGYLGIEGRHAFTGNEFIQDEFRTHHLYVGSMASISIQNFFHLRNYLREHPEYIKAYGNLKIENAKKFDDIDLYIEAKSSLIREILLNSGMDKKAVSKIFDANKIDE